MRKNLIFASLFILFLVFFAESSSAITITETRYFRSDTHTVNGLNAYKLGTSNTDSYLSIGTIHAGGASDYAYFRFDVAIRHSDGTETLLGSNVAQTSRGGSSSNWDYQSNTWNCPETSLDEGDAIKITAKVYLLGSESWRSFITEPLGAPKLSAATWIFTQWTKWIYDKGGPGLLPIHGAYIYHGSPSYVTRIDGISYETYTDCGLRIFNGSQIVTIACEPSGTLTSPLRIRKGSTTYGIVLVDPADTKASKVRIQIAGNYGADQYGEWSSTLFSVPLYGDTCDFNLETTFTCGIYEQKACTDYTQVGPPTYGYKTKNVNCFSEAKPQSLALL